MTFTQLKTYKVRKFGNKHTSLWKSKKQEWGGGLGAHITVLTLKIVISADTDIEQSRLFK